MTTPRALILADGGKEGVYHCVSRCVRRAYLCGDDFQSGKNFDHRKGWVHDRLIFLSKIFTIDVLGYALMSTHCHSILRVRPDLLEALDDEQVARRWLMLYPKKSCPPGTSSYEELVKITALEKPRLLKLRARLGNISWFMKSLNVQIPLTSIHPIPGISVQVIPGISVQSIPVISVQARRHENAIEAGMIPFLKGGLNEEKTAGYTGDWVHHAREGGRDSEVVGGWL